jgi:hypothetical protein
LEILKGRNKSEDLCVDKRIILEWISKKQVREVWTGFIWLRIGTSGDLSYLVAPQEGLYAKRNYEMSPKSCNSRHFELQNEVKLKQLSLLQQVC